MPKKLIWFLFPFLPSLSRACAVCFGDSSPDMVKGFYWGILLLLSAPFVLMGGLAGLIAYHIKKNKTSAGNKSVNT